MGDSADIAAQMRAGLRRFAKAVVVITAQHGEQRFAMAATAVSELSMDPPSMLICVNRSASIHKPLSEGAGFCLNILHSSQEAISAVCSGGEKGEVRFQHGAWAKSANGLPYLEDAQACFLCVNDQSVDYGTHTVFIGRVEEVLTNGAVDPLVYVDGRYTTVGPASE